MHQENDQSSVTAEADGLNSAFEVTSGITSQNMEGGTEPSLKSELLLHRHEATAPVLAKKKTALFYIYALFMEDRTWHRFSVQGPRAIDFSLLTMSLWSNKSMHFIKPVHLSKATLAAWWMCFDSAKVNVLSITFWRLPEDLQRIT